MLRQIVDSLRYRRASHRSRKLCARLSREFGVGEARIYSLMRGKRARDETELGILQRLKDLGVLRRIKE